MSFIRNSVMHHLDRFQASALLFVTGISFYMLTTTDLSFAKTEIARMMLGVDQWLGTLYLQGV